MKKLLLIPVLLAGSLALANQKKYEISPMIGYNFAETNLNIKDDGYPVGGVELQFNTPDSKISPEFSVLYSQGVDYKSGTAAKFKPGQDTKVTRGMFNGVYTFDKQSSFIPFAKLGAGVENISNASDSVKNGFFFDAGAGAKVPFTENIALKLEAIYMAKLGSNNAGFADSNLVTMVGITFAFGGDETKAAPVIIDGDIDGDKDGVIDAVDDCPNTLAGVTVDAKGCDADKDKDGVLNAVDDCPNTLAGVTVDAKGCDADKDKDGVLNAVDDCPNTLAGVTVDAKGCDADKDKDGVLNAQDLCPDTLAGEAVSSDGCPKMVSLNVNFENNSAVIKSGSFADIDVYARFLKENTNYSAKIIGYTDSRGSASYNQKLSEKRANAIVTDLISKGVNSKQLSAVGAGENNPIANNATTEGRAQNRRIEAELTRN